MHSPLKFLTALELLQVASCISSNLTFYNNYVWKLCPRGVRQGGNFQRRVVAIFQFGNSHGAEPSRSSDRYEAMSKPSLRWHIKKTLEKNGAQTGVHALGVHS